jgi:PAS domain S-box-containing protein
MGDQHAVATVAIDSAGLVTTFDDGAEALFGHPAGRVIGRPMDEVIIPEPLRQAHHDGMARFLRTREPFLIGRTIEITALHADGSVFPVELTLGIASDDPLVLEATLRRAG